MDESLAKISGGEEYDGGNENYDPNGNYNDYGDNGGDEFNQFDDEENVLLPGVDDLPLFANPETKKLDAEVKEKEQKLQDVQEKIGHQNIYSEF